MASMDAETWSVEHDGRRHEVRVERRRGVHRVEWRVDGRELARAAEREKKVVLTPTDEDDAALGAVAARGPRWRGATRRVVLLPAEAVTPERKDDEQEEDAIPQAVLARFHLMRSLDKDTVDLVPEPGSAAERHQQWVERHPRLHVVREVLGAGGGVLVPLLFLAVVVPVVDRFVPEGPDIPSIPLPDLPSISLPDLPDIPFPDLPNWLGTALKLVVAVAVAWSLASAEVRRRRKAAAEKGRPGHPSHPRAAQDGTRTPAD